MHGDEKRFHPDEKLKSFFLHKTTETDPAFRKALMQIYHRIAEVVFAYNPSLWYFLVVIMGTSIIVASDMSTRRTERRNRSVHVVHEDFEHRATKQSWCAAN